MRLEASKQEAQAFDLCSAFVLIHDKSDNECMNYGNVHGFTGIDIFVFVLITWGRIHNVVFPGASATVRNWQSRREADD